MKWLLAAALLAAACSKLASRQSPDAGGSSGSGGAQAGSGGAPPPPSSPDAAGGSGGGPALDGPAATADARRDGPTFSMPGEPVGLPMVVTDHFENRGWFGDDEMVKSFGAGATVIVESNPITGLCGARPAGARGKCLQFVYTPPVGYTPPLAGSWIGDFFLRTLIKAHPEVLPPAAAGGPNWGYEPGVTLPPGATAVSFYAASATDGLVLTIRIGTASDTVVLEPQKVVLTTEWRQYHIPLTGVDSGANLFGPFAWVIEDTAGPATLFLDDIVWDGMAPAP